MGKRCWIGSFATFSHTNPLAISLQKASKGTQEITTKQASYVFGSILLDFCAF